jgi:hypothetical protein
MVDRILAIAPPGGMDPSTFAIYNSINALGGTTKKQWWPGWEITGSVLTGFGTAGDLVPSDEGGAVTLEAEFIPIFEGRNASVHLYRFTGDNNRHLLLADHADLSYEADDEPFSGAMWVLPMGTAYAALQTLFAKYNEGVATEYSFHLTSTGLLQLDLYDGTDGATGNLRYTALSGPELHQCSLVGFSYAGDEGEVDFFVNGERTDGAGIAAVETSAYANMDDTAATFMVGGRDDGGVPDDLLDAWASAPIIRGGAWTELEHRQLFNHWRNLVGV